MSGAWARVPLRIKLTLAFTGVMAVLLAAAGIALSLLVARNLDGEIDAGLSARAGDAAALVATGSLAESGEQRAQLLSGDGRVLDGTRDAGMRPLLTARELRTALKRPLIVDRHRDDGAAALRLYGRPTRTDGGRAVVVIGESLAQREQSLESLHALLVVGGPLALAIASLVGSALGAFALRPVERMRRRAEAITAGEIGGRLPVPAAGDEIGRLGRTLNEMLARLESAFARERAFVSDASHELRTPLAIMRTELELALRGAHTREELENAIRSAAEETERLIALAEDLLVIARADQGRLPIRRTRLHADDLLETLVRRFAPRVGADGVLRAEPAPGVELLGDGARLEQALGNLVENALRHGHGPVTLSAHADDGRVELHVRDGGPGFPADFLPRAFERFSRADEGRTGAGTGLGLAIASVIAAAHGGRARAANLPGGGADVWVELPSGLPAEAARPRRSGVI